MSVILEYPLDGFTILKKKKAIKRELLLRTDFIDKRIAMLGGSTTAEIKDILELFLLKEGIRPSFYESSFGLYYEEAIFPNHTLMEFQPEIIYIHTTNRNLLNHPEPADSPEIVDQKFDAELQRFRMMWEKLRETFHCPIIQNNFELPEFRVMGNLDAAEIQGQSHFINRLNLEFAGYARSHPDFFVNDIHYLAASLGLEKWFNRNNWLLYKYAISHEAIPPLSQNLARMITAIFGRSKKCLVVDLDNTLWGGVIGDDGVGNIKLGRETAIGEAYCDFQAYLKALKNRGVALAICSKNEMENVREGLNHPDSFLHEDDFAAIVANWQPKPENIRLISQKLNLGLESFVFIDDNPAERELVRKELPMVAVPEIGSDVTKFIEFIDRNGYFEPARMSMEDFNRSRYYQENQKRDEMEKNCTTHDDFLRTLEMKAEISCFKPIYLDRITQLTNKTNQFNFTTRRYTLSEMESIARDEKYITLYGRLTDKFGDNGIVSVMVGEVVGEEVRIDLWLMSCRVFNRGMELAMFDCFVEQAKQRNVKTIIGYYFPTAKNEMLSEKLREVGFCLLMKKPDGSSQWKFDVSMAYEPENKFIEIKTV